MVERTLSHYTLIERLGAGGMGVVWRARDQRLERDVALKVLREDALRDDTARARFRREALAVAQLLHPNVGAIFDFDRDEDGTDFLVMEYVPGDCLSTRIERGPLPIAEAVDLGLQIAVALEASHELGVVHCDLKPANVVVTPKGVAKVLDFGLARLLSAEMHSIASVSSTPPTLAGTLPYMAPEQLTNGRLDARTDVWALGAILYEMATGRRAFDDPQAAALIYAIMNTAPVAPSRLRPDIPPALEATILRALEKNPGKRHAAAGDVALELRAVLLGRGTPIPAASPPVRGPAITSLAVLPLANLSGDPSQEFFADGMTDALIADLARIRALRVISRSSVMQYKGSQLPLPEIARRLRVDGVVEGSVVRSPRRVRVTAQLIDAIADRHLWANSYERDVDDVVALQGEVARAIADEIRVELTPREQARLASARPVDPRAFDATLEGRWYWNRRGAPEIWKAVEYFHRALEIDPSYAPAHAGLADSYMILGDMNVLPPREATIRARESATRALALDDQLAEAHTSLGFFLHFFEWDWEGADRAFRQAIALNPGYATAHQWYAELLVGTAQFDEAVQSSRRAIELDPLSPIMANSLADVLYFCRRYDECIEHLRRMLVEHPAILGLWSDLGRVCAQVGRHAESIDAFHQLAKLRGSDPDEIAGLGHAYAMAGRAADARRVLARLEERARRTFLSAHTIAVIHVALGEHDRAFEWLERGFEERDRALVWLRVHPRLDPLRGDPRLEALMKKMGLL